MMKGKDDDPDIVLHAAGWNYLEVPKSEDCNYAITGYESQVVTVKMAIGDSCQAEPGVMMYLTAGVRSAVSCDPATCCGRCCGGESCCVVNFSNTGAGGNNGFVALTPNFPTAKVIPVDMSSPHVGGKLIAQKGAFMASYGDVHIATSLDCNFMRCCCSGLGLIRQKIKGTGTVFLESTGTIVQKVLQAGETVLVDTECVLAYADSCKLDLRRTGGILGMMGGGEGIFNTTLTGPGLVIMVSMNQSVFLQSLAVQKIYRR